MNRRPKQSWREVAAKLAEKFPVERWDPEVRAWLHSVGKSSARWAVALSGGADSVALLLLLWARCPEHRRRLVALHFDHRLRGAAAARRDLEFCRQLCAALRVPLRTESWQRSRVPRTPPPSEAEARAARLAFFAKHARVVWLGHNQDDVAETMLMRLARGSGAGGLSAPRSVQSFSNGRVHLRPLLVFRKSDLKTSLRVAGGAWREDVTNARFDYFRNRVRHEVLPALVAAARRDAVAGAARSRELLAEDDAALDAWADSVRAIGKSGDLLTSRLVGCPRAVVRRVLHRWLAKSEYRIDVSRQAFEALLLVVERRTSTRHSLGPNLFARLRNGRLRLEFGMPKRKF